jgi:hypothetical protein
VVREPEQSPLKNQPLEQLNAFHDDGDPRKIWIGCAGCSTQRGSSGDDDGVQQVVAKGGESCSHWMDCVLLPREHVSLTWTASRRTDGPFGESKQVIGGYWIIQVRSREEAIEWAKPAPMSNNERIEVRQIHEMSDFPEDVQKAAERVRATDPVTSYV